jgi:hypothetical protein
LLVSCGEGEHADSGPSGALELYANAKRCPIIGAYSANPAVTGVGQQVALQASAAETDAPRAISFLWVASTGTFADSQAAATAYTCAAIGIQMVELLVTDGSCVDYAELPIECVAARDP